jgi:hypothetical protein
MMIYCRFYWKDIPRRTYSYCIKSAHWSLAIINCTSPFRSTRICIIQYFGNHVDQTLKAIRNSYSLLLLCFRMVHRSPNLFLPRAQEITINFISQFFYLTFNFGSYFLNLCNQNGSFIYRVYIFADRIYSCFE